MLTSGSVAQAGRCATGASSLRSRAKPLARTSGSGPARRQSSPTSDVTLRGRAQLKLRSCGPVRRPEDDDNSDTQQPSGRLRLGGKSSVTESPSTAAREDAAASQVHTGQTVEISAARAQLTSALGGRSEQPTGLVRAVAHREQPKIHTHTYTDENIRQPPSTLQVRNPQQCHHQQL